MKYQKVIETARLTLRPFTFSDCADVTRLAGDLRVAQMTATIPHPYEPGDAAAWIATHDQRFALHRAVHFAVTLQNGDLIGAVGLEPVNGPGNAELGYWIGVSYWNNGYCTEAAAAVIRYGMHELGYERITSYHFGHNPASGRVMKKCGMQWQDRVAGGASRYGMRHDRVSYVLDAPVVSGGGAYTAAVAAAS